ncbi:MAG: DUF1846 domain-containing protein [archaeon]|nr:DUF1846 domain-containing protein [archaeon]
MVSVKIGFDNDLYLKAQSERIRERVDKSGGKLYLELGGKLFDDYHASRVLPGFKNDSKISMLLQLKDQAEAIVAISADDIEKNKIRDDLSITYDLETMRLIDSFISNGIPVCGVVLTRYAGQHASKVFERRLKDQNINVYHHYPISGYPIDMPLIVSENGFGRNDYVKTSKPLIIVAAPGPGSGKMAVCLSQMYHENQRGIKVDYAKFETFPVWNLSLNHPVNIAYEAATADLGDSNMIDPFHLEAYGKIAVNYNRDIEVFPILNAMLEKIKGTSLYKSPTDVGVNLAGNCIIDDAIVCRAARNEISRRYFKALCDKKQGKINDAIIARLEMLMKKSGTTEKSRNVVVSVRNRMKNVSASVAAIELPDGTIVSGKEGNLLGALSALILNALKILANIPDNIHLLKPDFIKSVQNLKINYYGSKNARLTTNDVLIALSTYSSENENAARALEQLPKLKGCDAHTSTIPSALNEELYKKLGICLTSEPRYQTSRLFQLN